MKTGSGIFYGKTMKDLWSSWKDIRMRSTGHRSPKTMEEGRRPPPIKRGAAISKLPGEPEKS